MAAVSVLVLLGALVLMFLADSTSAPQSNDPQPAVPTIAPAPTRPPPSLAVDSNEQTVDSIREPVPQGEVQLTNDDTVVLRDLQTREIIWESRPFTNPELLRVGGGTLSVTSAGNRVILSLIDGTQLPP